MAAQTEDNNHNLLYFEATSMRALHQAMDDWQRAKGKRLLSVSIQKDGDNFCCVALTNPTEVVITGPFGQHAGVTSDGCLYVFTNNR